MITEDYVSFEISKLLKEKGFDEPIEMLIREDGTRYHADTNSVSRKQHIVLRNSEINMYSTDISCPTLQMAMKWLREVHNIIITMDYDEYELEKIDKKQVGYGWNIQEIENPTKYLKISEHVFDTYEESIEDSLKYCLTNLI